MSIFTDILTQATDHFEIPEIKPFSSDFDYMKWQCDNYNNQQGNLHDYDCPECKNRGYFYKIVDDVIVQSECKCLTIRNSLKRLKNSGLENLAERFTFDKFRTEQIWQARAKEKAIEYTRENSEKWLFFGGQSGCGKTHLCTAVCMELINQGHDVKYVLWRDLVHFAEQNRFRKEFYDPKIQELQSVDVLYIDDFLKNTHKVNGTIQPTETESNTAYEIINSRIIANKRTIISSELHISDIVKLDEATGGRISEASKGYQIQINFDKNRNFRFIGG